MWPFSIFHGRYFENCPREAVYSEICFINIPVYFGHICETYLRLNYVFWQTQWAFTNGVFSITNDLLANLVTILYLELLSDWQTHFK